MEFASAASPVAVCGFCRSTLAREGDALRRIGVAAELFDDHSPLQVGASGRWQGLPFTIVGRLQLGYAQGRWSEWHALFDNGRSGWLAEDNGRYVMAFAQPAVPVLPARELFVPGAAFALEGRDWRVASVVEARVEAAQGELPSVPRLGEALHAIDATCTHGNASLCGGFVEPDGSVEFLFDLSAARGIDTLFERRPDLYCVVHDDDGTLLYRSATLPNVDFLSIDPVTDERPTTRELVFAEA